MSSENSSQLERYNTPAHHWRFIDFKELWQFRRLLVLLTWRDVQVRYKQTLLGLFWAVINPFITMIVFSFVFNRLANVSSYDVPYPIFTYSGLVIWNLFARGLTVSSMSVVSDGSLMAKVYFPRIISPLAKLGSGFVDFLMAFVVLLLMQIILQVNISPRIILLPFFIIPTLLSAAGIGLWFSALYVRYRDIGQIVPFLAQTWMYLTPVAYPTDLLAENWRLLYSLNPMVGMVDGFRWAIIDGYPLYTPSLVIGTLISIILFVSGVFIFHRLEKTFIDYL